MASRSCAASDKPRLAKPEEINGASELLIMSQSASLHPRRNPLPSFKAARPDLRILVTRAQTDDEMILKTLMAGAKDMWTRPLVSRNLLKPSRSCRRDRFGLLAGCFRSSLSGLPLLPGRFFQRAQGLSLEREKETLELLAAGRSNREIGEAMGIGERTVKAHVAKLLRKVGVRNRVALSVHAISNSLLK